MDRRWRVHITQKAIAGARAVVAVGRILDEPEPTAVARALLEVLELAEDRGTARACRRRAEQFSRERCVDAYRSLYQEIGAGA